MHQQAFSLHSPPLCLAQPELLCPQVVAVVAALPFKKKRNNNNCSFVSVDQWFSSSQLGQELIQHRAHANHNTCDRSLQCHLQCGASVDQKVGHTDSVTAAAFDICSITELKEAICPQLNMHDNRRIDSAFKSCPISEQLNQSRKDTLINIHRNFFYHGQIYIIENKGCKAKIVMGERALAANTHISSAE